MAYLLMEMVTVQDCLTFSATEKREREMAQGEHSQNGLRISCLLDCTVWDSHLIEGSENWNLNTSKFIKYKPSALEKLKKSTYFFQHYLKSSPFSHFKKNKTKQN